MNPAHYPTLLLSLFLSVTYSIQVLKADIVIADISPNQINVDVFYTGSQLTIFGTLLTSEHTTNPNNCLITTITGPRQTVTVHRQYQQVQFINVPKFYSIASSPPVEQCTTPTLRKQYEIGIPNLHFDVRSEKKTTTQQVKNFRNAFIHDMLHTSLYQENLPITILKERLFKISVTFPTNIPTGEYEINVFLVQNQKITEKYPITLTVKKTGLNQSIFFFAQHYPFFYGCVSVLFAILVGWLSHRLFRA